MIYTFAFFSRRLAPYVYNLAQIKKEKERERTEILTNQFLQMTRRRRRRKKRSI
jgi:hypothetical protein